MSEKNVLIGLPKSRVVNYMDVIRDEKGEPVLDENKQPQSVISRTEVVSAVTGLDMALSNATALVQEGNDFFDVQDLRQKIKSAFDKRGRHDLDDMYLNLTEKQHTMLLSAVKKFDWTLVRKIPQPDGTVITTEPVQFWTDWFDFFTSIRTPLTHTLDVPNQDYALWLTEKKERLSKEEADEAEAIRKAAEEARKKNEGASSDDAPGTSDVTAPNAPSTSETGDA